MQRVLALDGLFTSHAVSLFEFVRFSGSGSLYDLGLTGRYCVDTSGYPPVQSVWRVNHSRHMLITVLLLQVVDAGWLASPRCVARVHQRLLPRDRHHAQQQRHSLPQAGAPRARPLGRHQLTCADGAAAVAGEQECCSCNAARLPLAVVHSAAW